MNAFKAMQKIDLRFSWVAGNSETFILIHFPGVLFAALQSVAVFAAVVGWIFTAGWGLTAGGGLAAGWFAFGQQTIGFLPEDRFPHIFWDSSKLLTFSLVFSVVRNFNKAGHSVIIRQAPPCLVYAVQESKIS